VAFKETRLYDDRGTQNCHRIFALRLKYCYRVHRLSVQPSLIYNGWLGLFPREIKRSGREAYLHLASRLKMSGAKRPLLHMLLWPSWRVIYRALLLTVISGAQCGETTVTPLTPTLHVRRRQQLFRPYELVASPSGLLPKRGNL
jgi:hypothetical protein